MIKLDSLSPVIILSWFSMKIVSSAHTQESLSTVLKTMFPFTKFQIQICPSEWLVISCKSWVIHFTFKQGDPASNVWTLSRSFPLMLQIFIVQSDDTDASWLEVLLNSASQIPFLWAEIVLTKIPWAMSMTNNYFCLVPATASLSLGEHQTKLMSSEETQTDLNFPYSRSHILISPVKSAETNTLAVFLPMLSPAMASECALYFLAISNWFY